MSDRLLKYGVVFGVIVSVALAVACGGGGGGGGGGGTNPDSLGEPDTVAMGLTVSYPSASAKPGILAVGDEDAGALSITDLASGDVYAGTLVEGSKTVVGGMDTFRFVVPLPEDVPVSIDAKRELDDGTVEKVQAIISETTETGDTDEVVNTDTTKAAAIVKKKAANAGVGLHQIAQTSLGTAVQQANAIVGGTYFAGVDFTALTAQEIQDMIVEYAVMLAVAILAEQYAADWIDDYETVDDADVAQEAADSAAAIETAIEQDATDAGATDSVGDVSDDVATVDETVAGSSGGFDEGDTQTVQPVLDLYIAAVSALKAKNISLANDKLEDARNHAEFASALTSTQNKVKFLYALLRMPCLPLASYTGGPATSAPSDYGDKDNLGQMMSYHQGIQSVSYVGFNADDQDDLLINDGIGLEIVMETGWGNGGLYLPGEGDEFDDLDGDAVLDAGEMWYDENGNMVFDLELDWPETQADTIDERTPSSNQLSDMLDGIMVGELASTIADLKSLPTDFYFQLSPAMQGNSSTHTVQFDYADVIAVRIYYNVMKFMLDYVNAWDVDFTDPDALDAFSNLRSLEELQDAAADEEAEDQIMEDLFGDNASLGNADATKLATARATLKTFLGLTQDLVNWVQAFHAGDKDRGLYPREIDPDPLVDDDEYTEENRTFHLVVNLDDFWNEFDDDIKDMLDLGDTAGAQAEIDARWDDVANGELVLADVLASCNGPATIRLSALDAEESNQRWNLSAVLGVQASGYDAFSLRKLMYDDTAGALVDGLDDLLDTKKYYGIWPGINHFLDDTVWTDGYGGIFQVWQSGPDFEIDYQTYPWNCADGTLSGSSFTLDGDYYDWHAEQDVEVAITGTINAAGTSMSGTRTDTPGSSNSYTATKLNDDNIIIQGEVLDQTSGDPISGAVVSTSLDAATATTNSQGKFVLQTTSLEETYGDTQYTITVTATGYTTSSSAWFWGSYPYNQEFWLAP